MPLRNVVSCRGFTMGGTMGQAGQRSGIAVAVFFSLMCAAALLCGASKPRPHRLSASQVGGCALAREDFIVGANPIVALSVDVNGDGLPDIVTASARAQSLSVLL